MQTLMRQGAPSSYRLLFVRKMMNSIWVITQLLGYFVSLYQPASFKWHQNTDGIMEMNDELGGVWK